MVLKMDNKIDIKSLSSKSLNKLILALKKCLKKEKIVKEMFNEYNVPIEEIDYIPMMFDDIDVSAKTSQGVIIFNYRLLDDGDFVKDFSYGVHELTHWLQQTTSDKAIIGKEHDCYLNDELEQEGFQNQIQYIEKHYGEDEAEKYVDHLLNHHEIKGKERRNLKDILIEKTENL